MTTAQRVKLEQIAADLRAAFALLPDSFWLSRSQEDAYKTVLRHLTAWAFMEGDGDD